MASVNFKQLSADDCYARWQQHVKRIKNETVYLFTTRQHFREVRRMFQENKRLNEIGGEVYRWLLGIWGRDALIALRRELDGQSNTVNLMHLFEEMKHRPTVMTRRRYLAHCTKDDHPYIREMMNKAFTRWGAVSDNSGDPLDDYIPADATDADQKALEVQTRKAFDYAQRMIAHRTPVEGLEIKPAEINAAIDAIEPMLQKYYLMFTASSLVSATAVAQYDWGAPFDFAWRTPGPVNEE
jgi:hypothetical protein